MPRTFRLRWPVVGFAGREGSGKDTAARLMHTYVEATSLSFAAPLKGALATWLGWTDEWENRGWRETPLPGLGKSPRFLARTLGTDWARDMVHPDFWLHVADARLKTEARPYPLLITDVRFANEVEWIHERGGVVCAIIRAGQEPGAASHPTEAMAFEADIHIRNEGTFREFDTKLTQALLTQA